MRSFFKYTVLYLVMGQAPSLHAGSQSAFGLNMPNYREMCTYRAVVTIHHVAGEIAKKLRSEGVGPVPFAEQLELEPLRAMQSEEGVFLISQGQPELLQTPWGEVSLFEDNNYNPVVQHRIWQDFCRRIQLNFIINTRELFKRPGTDEVFYCVEADRLQALSESDLENYRNTNTNIVSAVPDNYSRYAVTEVMGIPLPVARLRQPTRYLTLAEAMARWRLAQSHYIPLNVSSH